MCLKWQKQRKKMQWYLPIYQLFWCVNPHISPHPQQNIDNLLCIDYEEVETFRCEINERERVHS